MQEQLGDLRLNSFIHPDSLNQKVWEVEQLVEATGQYALKGETYWKHACVCTSKEEAEEYIKQQEKTIEQ